MTHEYIHHQALNYRIVIELASGEPMTELMHEALREFEAIAAVDPLAAASGYYVIITVDSKWRSERRVIAENHIEAHARTLYHEPLENGDSGECIVAGPCGFASCVCDGDPYVMRWRFAYYTA